MREIEASILHELRMVTGRLSLRHQDILRWSIGDVKVGDGETSVFLPELRIHCAVLTAALGK